MKEVGVCNEEIMRLTTGGGTQLRRMGQSVDLVVGNEPRACQPDVEVVRHDVEELTRGGSLGKSEIAQVKHAGPSKFDRHLVEE